MTTFSIEIIVHAGDVEVPEDKVLAHFEKFPNDFEDYGEVEGPVTFHIGDIAIRSEDALSYVLPTLALETMPSVVRDGQGDLTLYTSPANFHFTSNGTTVTMSGNYLTDSYTFAQTDFVTQSLNACRRFLTLSETIWPDAEDACAEIRALLAETEEELAG